MINKNEMGAALLLLALMWFNPVYPKIGVILLKIFKNQQVIYKKEPIMETLKQSAITAISKLPDTAKIKDIQVVLYKLIQENNVAALNETTEPLSFLEAAKDYIGCIKDAPKDLSYNKAYFDGFGL